MILHQLKSPIDRIGRNELNENFDRIEKEYNTIKYSFDKIIAETGNSNPEIVAARGLYTSLRERLEHHATKTEVEALVSGAPKGVYDTLSDLQTNLPNGDSTIYLVRENGHWYFWSGEAWTSGGVYQATKISSGTVGVYEVNDVILKKLKIAHFEFAALSNWEQGNIHTSNGNDIANNKRLRTVPKIYVTHGAKIELIDTTYQFAVFKYNVEGTFLGYDPYTTNYNVNDTMLIRLLIRRADDEIIDTSTIPSIINTITAEGAYQAYGDGGVFSNLETIPTIDNTEYITHKTNESNVNLLDTTAVTNDGYYDPSSLSWVSDTIFVQTAFINCEAGDLIRLSSNRLSNFVVFKNEQGVIFTGGTIGTSRQYTVPIDAVSFSISLRKTALSTFMITLNRNMPTVYTPFGSATINDERLLASLKDTKQRFKNANFLGDSITWGYSPYDGSQLSVRWVDLVKDMLNLNVVRNYGISGSTLGSNANGTRNPMVDRYVNMDDQADLICVAGGTNDWNFDVPLGNIDDTTKHTFYGALKIMMDGLYTKYPNATIVFFTPLHRKGDTKGANGNLKSYRDAIIEVGAMFGIAVLDLYATSGLYPDNDTNYNTLVPDGRHPNEAGHKKLANRIVGFLNTL